MALTTIGNDQPITAEKWNEFFAELDRKVGLIMDGKSVLLLGGDYMLPVMGRMFFFVRSELAGSYLPYATDHPVYDHTPFTDAAATLPATMFDAAKKIVALDDPVPTLFTDRVDMGPGLARFFDRSLEAHKQGENWIFERHSQVNYRPEKIYRYAQAEIMIEGPGWSDFQMDQRWNKYNFFRFHNLTGYAVQVSFAGYHSISIPRWESRCVRRTAVDAGYMDGWNYFNRFAPGDPRTFEMPWDSQTPHGSMGANNVISPALVYRFLDLVCGKPGGPRVYRDTHELYDVADLYPQFPAITDATVLGDLLHHAGELVGVTIDGAGAVTKQVFAFNGYGQLAADMAAAGISVTTNGDGSLTLGDATGLTHDLWSTGTNLLDAPMGDLAAGITLRTAVPASKEAIPALPTTGSDIRPWMGIRDNGDGTVALGETYTASVSVTSSVLSTAATQNNPNTVAIPTWTVRDIKTLDSWGDPAYPGQNTAAATFESRALTLTPFGLALTFSQRVDMARHPGWVANVDDGAGGFKPGRVDLRDTVGRLDGTALVFQKIIIFDGYGWATAAAPAFIGPRKAHIVSACPSDAVPHLPGILTPDVDFDHVLHHPSISGQPAGNDGADFAVIPYKRGRKKSDTTSIKRLTPLSPAWAQDFGTDENPFDFWIYPADVLDEFTRDASLSGYLAARGRYLANQPAARRAVRLNLLREHFNCLVTAVNALKKCSPFTVEMWERRLVPNTVGPFGGPYCPVNQFASFGLNSSEYAFFAGLGIPIKTEADLPASWAMVKATEGITIRATTKVSQNGTFVSQRIIYDDQGFRIGRDFAYDGFDEIGPTTLVPSPVHDNVPSLMASEIFGVSGVQEAPFRWVTVGDVQAVVEALGFKFQMDRMAAPYILKLFHVEPGISDVINFGLDRVPNSYLLQPRFRDDVGNPPPTFSAIQSYQTTFDGVSAMLTEAIDGESVEWIRSVEQVRLLDHRAGDVDIVRAVVPMGPVNTLNEIFIVLNYGPQYEYRLLRQRSDIVRTSPFDLQSGDIEIEPVRRRASVLVQSWVSPGLARTGTMVLARSPWLDYNGSEFSRQSRANALGRLAFGPIVIPLWAPPASVGAETVALNQEQNFIGAAQPIHEAAREPVLTMDNDIISWTDATFPTVDEDRAAVPGPTVTTYARDTLWVRDWPLALG